MEIKLSVIIPCYNHGKYLYEALASIDQSIYREQIEVIIINDGSTDRNTNKVIDELNPDKYIIINQENQGLARSRNNGILKAQADYLLMLDADNFIEQIFLSDFFKLINQNINFDALYGNSLFFGMENKIYKPGYIDLYRLINGNYIDACAIYKKQKLFDVGMYDTNMPYMGWEDWDLWLRLAFNNSIIRHSDKIYFHYRVLADSMIRSHNEIVIKDAFQFIYKKYLINLNNVDQIIESYINKSISFKTLVKLALKKLKLNTNFKYKISKKTN